MCDTWHTSPTLGSGSIHALRIKGFVKVENLAELAGLPEDEVLSHLQALQQEGHTNFRENRGLWQLTPDGREAYVIALEEDVSRPGFKEGLAVKYHRFLEMNEVFKALCSDWQLRDGETNDHSDAAYDEACIKRLGVLDDEAQPICHAFAEVAERFDCYAARLTGSRTALEGGGHADVHGRDVRFLPRRVDGAARGSAPHPGHRPPGRGQLLRARVPRRRRLAQKSCRAPR